MDTQRTKIVATIGPASASPTVVSAMISAGMDVARINFSHGTWESNGALMTQVRTAAREADAPVAVLMDLQGPRVRTVTDAEVALTPGAAVGITAPENQPSLEIPSFALDSADTVAALSVGDRILVEDGRYRLTVHDVREDGVVIAVANTAGRIASRKGVNLPDTDVPLPALTKKDKEDLDFGIRAGVEYVALSFVRRGEDIELLRQEIDSRREPGSPPVRIIAKIERPEALEAIDEIAAHADGIMVARGDLATEIGAASVVVAQKRIISSARAHAIPVIVATQMLESMTHNPRPTRAEISDVTNAVIDHTDAVMLSGETATGDYPVEAVTMMRDIIHATELSPYDDMELLRDAEGVEGIDAAYTICQTARDRGASVIAIATRDGVLPTLVSHFRPSARILVVTSDDAVRNALALVWGVEAYYDKNAEHYDAATLRRVVQHKTSAQEIVVIPMER